MLKNCLGCGGRYDRMPAELRRLNNGNTLDPNLYCPSCEVKIINQAMAIVTPPTPEQLAHWNLVCLRKDAFVAPHEARRVAKRMRRNQKGQHYPVDVYRCRIAIDPVLYPERAVPHWHIGGSERP